MQMPLEKMLVILLALFLFGIALRFLYAGPLGVLKALIAFVLGVICLLALRKAPQNRSSLAEIIFATLESILEAINA